ncbi:MAG: sugar ABC transporter permease, partial [Cellulomonas sp.]|nr:sugar ABC transporter permease [Cellulomonas sp.]
MSAPTRVLRAARRRQAVYWLYLLPGVLALTAVIIVPFGLNIFYSLHRWKGGLSPMHWYGLGNYADLLHDSAFWGSFRNSVWMIVAMVVVPTLIGLVLAAVLFDHVGKNVGSRTASLLRATYYLPQIMPVAVAGIVWNWIFNAETGALNTFLRDIGITSPPNWLGSPGTALPAVMLVLVWVQIGYPTVIFMSALQRVDPELYEAAELDGAG